MPKKQPPSRKTLTLDARPQRQEIQALQTQLRIAQDYNRAADSLARNIGQIVTGPQSTLSGTQQLAFLSARPALSGRSWKPPRMPSALILLPN